MRRDIFLTCAAIGTVMLYACMNDFDRFNFGEPPAQGGAGGQTVASTTVTVGGSAGMASSSTGMPQCITANDCPGVDMQCNQKVCTPSGMCVNIIPPIASPCTDLGPQCLDPDANCVCNGQGDCVECVDNLQCVSGICDTVTNTCVAASCGDSVMNGDETDTDCGGSCPDCANNKGCDLFSDCISGFCDTSMGPCGSGAGGSGGAPSVSGCCDACGGDTDCTGSTWCDTGNCVPKKANGATCNGGNECTSTFCVDGVCCNAACGAQCQGCTMAETGQANGTCANSMSGTSCSDSLFCTATDQCNGSGTCVGTGNPCSGHNAPPSCDDSCDESADNCLAFDMTGTACDEDADTMLGTCNATGDCLGD
jgi:hypothetical protein